jgi:hypothetical protein
MDLSHEDDPLPQCVHSATRGICQFVEDRKTIRFQAKGLVFGVAPSRLVGAG